MDAISGNDAGGETLVPEAELGRFVAEFAAEDIPAAVLAEGRRSLVNVFATAFTGCNEVPVAAMLRAGQPFSSATGCTVIGRRERADLLLASCINTASANIFDFDDTHEATIIHPAAAVFSALFAHAEQHGASGRDVLAAFVLGCEVECRIGNALTPWHYARGWHITSTCGVFGAAVAAARLLKVAPERMLHVISAAAAQSSGLVETLGTGAKSVSMGGAARNGYMSAVLAAEGCGGPARPLTGERGYLRVYAHEPDISWLTEGLGQDWEFAKNTYKPYPVGVVLNPVIEAVLDLRATEGLTLDRIERVKLSGHPLLRQRTDRAGAATGRQTQVSAQHAIAIALLTGRAGLEEFSDAAAQRTLEEGRPEVGFIDDPAREVDSAVIEVRLRDGSVLHREIAHAAGSRARPLSDAQLEEKLVSGARYAGYPGDTGKLIGALWNIDSAANAGDVIRLAGA